MCHSQNVRYRGKHLTHREKKKIYARSIAQELSGIWQTFNFSLWFGSGQYQMDEIVKRRKELGQYTKKE